MLSEFSRKKYVSSFNLLDADKSGTIEFEDFAAHARYIKDDQGWSDQDPKWLQLLDAKKRGWQKIQEAVDTNNDNKVSLEEWLTFCENAENQVRTSGKPAQWLSDIFHALFRSIDLDNDGTITLDEYSLYLKSIGHGNVDPVPLFNKVDLN